MAGSVLGSFINNVTGGSRRPDFSKQVTDTEAQTAIKNLIGNTIVSDTTTEEVERLTRYYLYMNFYRGIHWRKQNDTLLSFNYVAAFIDCVNSFLLGKNAFSFHVKTYDADRVPDEIEDPAEKFFKTHWAKNGLVKAANEILQMGSVMGDAWLLLEWDETRKYCKFSIPDSRYCFPKFKNGDYNLLEKFQVRFPLVKADSAAEYCLYCIEYTAQNKTEWYQKNTSATGVRYEEKVTTNELNFIPVVHFKNKTFPGYYGPSDVADVYKLNKQYNETMVQLHSIISYHAAPVTIITGAKVDTLQRGINQIWSGFPAEANIFNLGLESDMSSSMEFLKMLKTSMHEMSDVPESALGQIQAVSNTSAVALQTMYMPLVRQANKKALTYGDGIADVNDMILRITQIKNPGDKFLVDLMAVAPNFITDMRCLPVWSFGFPQDRMSELQIGVQAINAGLATRKSVMQGMGISNIPDELEEIKADALARLLLNMTPAAQSMQESQAKLIDKQVELVGNLSQQQDISIEQQMLSLKQAMASVPAQAANESLDMILKELQVRQSAIQTQAAELDFQNTKAAEAQGLPPAQNAPAQ